MKLRNMRVDVLKIPFTSRFVHAAAGRRFSDSIIVRLQSTDGDTGYGEAVVRPYVTGETTESCVRHIVSVAWPMLRDASIEKVPACTTGAAALSQLIERLPGISTDGVSFNGAFAALECALIDMLLRRDEGRLVDVIPPRTRAVTYSGIIGFGSVADNVRLALRLKEAGFRYVKCKVGSADDEARISAVRDALGPHTSLRLDANGAWGLNDAASRIERLARHDIACVEQPLPAGDARALAELQRQVDVPLMADESLVTVDDARRLIDASACRYFNLRVAKLGGLARTLAVADLARQAGIGLQVGCQVGETSILSALGRHLAAHLPDVEFVEGSYAHHLLISDVCRRPVHFEGGGIAPVLDGPGIGVDVDERLVRRFSVESTTCGEV